MREENNDLNLSLVAADINGCLTYWNVNDGKVISSVQEGSKSVVGSSISNSQVILLISLLVIVLFVCSYRMGAQDEQRRSFIPRCSAFSLQPCHMEYGQGLERMEEKFY